MDIAQLKTQSRELLRAIRSGDADALMRLRRHHKRWASMGEAAVQQQASLPDAKYVLAREHGFASWKALENTIAPSSKPRHTRLFVTDPEWMAERARGLLRTRASAGAAALEQIREWHPRFSGLSDEEILEASFTEADARLVYAREHGFETWDELRRRMNVVAANPAEMAAEPFLAAFTALQAGDLAVLNALLKGTPQLAAERGTNGNTLLNLAVSIAGKPDWTGGLGAVEALLDAGADPNDGNDRGWTPLHQAAYANKPEIAARLIAKGAELDAEAHGAGGTPLACALFWGHLEVADLLANHLVTPGNLRMAAGLGRTELVNACFQTDGSLTPEACSARGFYRPHSGFPDWEPSTDAQEVLDEALVWACKSNRWQILEQLVRAGARLNADPYRGTPLLWAAACNRPETVQWLLDHGANVNEQATFGGSTHGKGITALHLAAQHGHLAILKLLIAGGADRNLREALYHSTAESSAAFFKQFEAREYLRSLDG